MSKRNIQIDIRGWLESNFDVKPARFPDVSINCPYCFDEKQRLYVATHDHGDVVKGWGYCQHEQCRHDFYELYRDHENLTDGEAIEQLYTEDPDPKYGDIQEFLDNLGKPEIVEESKQLIELPKGYVGLSGLSTEKFAKLCPPYFASRNVNQTMCDTYRLGYCNHVDYRFRGRMIIPIYQHGSLVGFQGRAMLPAFTPKYLFNKGMVTGEYLYNFDAISDQYDWVILVEGVFDVWAMVRLGFPNTIASFGKHLTDHGIRTIVSRFKKIIILWDDDATMEIAELSERLEGMIEVLVSSLQGKDPDEAVPDAVFNCIANSQMYDRAYYREAIIRLIETK